MISSPADIILILGLGIAALVGLLLLGVIIAAIAVTSRGFVILMAIAIGALVICLGVVVRLAFKM